MLTVLYFAWVREQVGLGEEEISLADDMRTVADVVAYLRSLSAAHQLALADITRLRFAVNQEHVGLDAPIADGDELAIFPPVTGG